MIYLHFISNIVQNQKITASEKHGYVFIHFGLILLCAFGKNIEKNRYNLSPSHTIIKACVIWKKTPKTLLRSYLHGQ